jgi:hypothetical protein
MSGRFVRASKFRHIFGKIAKKELAYQNVKASLSGEGNFIAASDKFIAVPAAGGGGPCYILNVGKYEKLGANPLKLNVHKGPVLDVAFSPYQSNLLATADDIGHIAFTMIPEGAADIDKVEAFSKIPEAHSKKVCIINWNPNFRNIIGSCGFDNAVKVFDVNRTDAAVWSTELPDLPFYIDWNMNGTLLASSCKDRSIRIQDPRQDAKSVMKTEGLEAKPFRVLWADSVNKLVAVGQLRGERVISVYDPKKLGAPLTVCAVDSSGSAMIPFFDNDNSVLYLSGKGDATVRYYELVDADSGDGNYCFPLADARDNESSKGACFLPKSACDVKICEVALHYRVMRDWISPVSFTVPRKSETFQSDLFPDTYASPSYDAADYEKMANKEHKAPVKRSLDPKKAGDFKQEEFKAPARTKETVQSEIAALMRACIRSQDLA